MKKKLKIAALAVVVLAAIYANNTNRLAAHREGTLVLLWRIAASPSALTNAS